MASPRIVIIIGLIITLVLSTAGSATPGDYSFSYSKTMTVKGSPSGTQFNYPVKVILFNKSGTDTSGGIFLGQGTVSPEWNDVRFSKESDSVYFPYWIESTNETSATIWVNVPFIPPEGVDVAIRYGNPNAPDLQDGYATFTLFDNFDGTSLNTGRWTASPGVTVSNSIATITASSDTSYYISSTARFGTGYRIVARIRPHDFGGTKTTEFFYASFNDDTMQDTAYYSHIYGAYSGTYFNDNGGGPVGSGSIGSKITGIFPYTWNRHEAIKQDTAITWTVNSGIPYIFPSDYYSGPGSVRFATYRAGTEDVDWVFVGKYVYPEPSVVIHPAGSETPWVVPESTLSGRESGDKKTDNTTGDIFSSLFMFIQPDGDSTGNNGNPKENMMGIFYTIIIGIILIGILLEGWKLIKNKK